MLCGKFVTMFLSLTHDLCVMIIDIAEEMRVLCLLVERCLFVLGTVGESNPFDGDVLVTHLTKIYEQLHTLRKDLLPYLRQEVALYTHEQAMLLFIGEKRPANFADAQTFSVHIGSIVYGTLLVLPKKDPTRLDYFTALNLASFYGSILYMYELSWCTRELMHTTAAIQEDGPVEPSTLTPRQLEVLRLMCQRYTKQEIMQKLHITSSTLQKHRLAIYNRLHVKCESDVLVVAFHQRLFSPFKALLELS